MDPCILAQQLAEGYRSSIVTLERCSPPAIVQQLSFCYQRVLLMLPAFFGLLDTFDP